MAIRDVKIAFNRPFFAPTVASATRMFTDEVNRVEPNNEMNRHPEDYSLYHIGSFNDEIGAFELLPQPQLILQASNIYQQSPNLT